MFDFIFIIYFIFSLSYLVCYLHQWVNDLQELINYVYGLVSDLYDLVCDQYDLIINVVISEIFIFINILVKLIPNPFSYANLKINHFFKIYFSMI